MLEFLHLYSSQFSVDDMNPISLRTRWICLTGFMGAGKSTVGACLAEMLGWRFVDLDSEIVKREGRSIAAIFAALGEPTFRQIESDVLRFALQDESRPAVIALGGGTFVQTSNRDLLRTHGAETIYLEADFDLLHARCCQEDGTRPLMQYPAAFRALFETRRPIYALADRTVSVNGHSAAAIAAEIAESVVPGSSSKAVSD
jgi:shikimate kinase